eukprot:4093624-Amphidinium_carterae.1
MVFYGGIYEFRQRTCQRLDSMNIVGGYVEASGGYPCRDVDKEHVQRVLGEPVLKCIPVCFCTDADTDLPIEWRPSGCPTVFPRKGSNATAA